MKDEILFIVISKNYMFYEILTKTSSIQITWWTTMTGGLDGKKTQRKETETAGGRKSRG
jgi:hypothetical protein